ncbi:MAG: SMI1/KNR4 family protein [Pirellulales bacterium]
MTINEAFAILHSLPPEWGATESEISAVEATLGVRLPATLRELMRCTGRKEHIEWLFPEREIGSVDELPELQEIAAEILAGDPTDLHPPFPFVTLSQHQGYYFSFVRAGDADADPVLLGYNEGRGCVLSDGVSLRKQIAQAVMRAVMRT